MKNEWMEESTRKWHETVKVKEEKEKKTRIGEGRSGKQRKWENWTRRNENLNLQKKEPQENDMK